jgi:sec-independent protein translocase protein TatA
VPGSESPPARRFERPTADRPHHPIDDERRLTVHFGTPAEIFGMDGIIVLVVVVLVLFGSTQIPKLARSLGSAQKEFKKGVHEGASDGTADVEVAVPVGGDVVVTAHPAATADTAAGAASSAARPTAEVGL